MVNISQPSLFAQMRASSKIKKLFKNEESPVQDHLIFIEQAFPHNVTIEMGLDLFDLSQTDDVEQTETPSEFIEKLSANQLSTDFMDKWQNFMDRYGHRCPSEMDPGEPRFRETPGKIFALLKTMSTNQSAELTPHEVFEMGIQRRKKSLKYLIGILEEHGKRKLKAFLKYYKVIECFVA